jgi:cytochrome bd ubiquinol oxidase subunit II
MLANVVLVFLWGGITAYVLLGGADFGAGFWDLLAGSARGGAPQRQRIAQSIGPVWEANHVWLIFALVVTWTGFPTVFASIASTLYIPLTIVAFGIILRGSAFAFRKTVTQIAVQRIFGISFALSSVITPFFLGMIAGAIASGRVPLGVAQGNVVSSWLNPTSVIGGALAVEVAAYLAAVYLIRDCERAGDAQMAAYFRVRALVMGVVTGVTALLGIAVLHADAPVLYSGLTHRGLALVVLSALAGALSIVLILLNRHVAVRLTAALAVVSVLWAWGAAQYPDILSGTVTVNAAAAPEATLVVLVITLAVGTVLLIPSLLLLYGVQASPTPSTHRDLPDAHS